MLCLFNKEQVCKIKEYFKNEKDCVFCVSDDEKDVFDNEKRFFVQERYDFVFQIDDLSEKSEKFIGFWTGHNHFRYKKSYEEIFEEIKHSLETSFEIEKKFLIEYPDISHLNSFSNVQAVYVEQAYLKEDEKKIRVRKRGFDGNFIYYKTMKKSIAGMKKQEIEEKLTKEQYEKYKEKAQLFISKTRFCISENNTYYELDVYPFWKDKATLEIELTNENEEYVLPKNIKVIKDVSEDKSYSNYNLSKQYKKGKV